jgi:mono/diheme cytochrome c family protein
MVRHTLPLALIMVTAFAPFGAHSDDKLVLKSASVDLPSDDRMFPGGRGSDLTSGNCLACHSADMVLNQPAMSKTQWREGVEKMRAAYKAPIDAKDVDTIVDYLVRIGGGS